LVKTLKFESVRIAKCTQPGSEASLKQAAGIAAAENISAKHPKAVLVILRLQPETSRTPYIRRSSDFEYTHSVDMEELSVVCFSAPARN